MLARFLIKQLQYYLSRAVIKKSSKYARIQSFIKWNN